MFPYMCESPHLYVFVWKPLRVRVCVCVCVCMWVSESVVRNGVGEIRMINTFTSTSTHIQHFTAFFPFLPFSDLFSLTLSRHSSQHTHTHTHTRAPFLSLPVVYPLFISLSKLLVWHLGCNIYDRKGRINILISAFHQYLSYDLFNKNVWPHFRCVFGLPLHSKSGQSKPFLFLPLYIYIYIYIYIAEVRSNTMAWRLPYAKLSIRLNQSRLAIY